MTEETSPGGRYQDTVTGFVGTATARVVYLHDEPQVCLEILDSDGKPAREWFAETRLVAVPEEEQDEDEFEEDEEEDA